MVSIDMKQTGENIKQFRKQLNISVKDIVNNTGVSERAVFKWQQGISIPTVDNLVVLSKMFGVTMEQIISII